MQYSQIFSTGHLMQNFLLELNRQLLMGISLLGLTFWRLFEQFLMQICIISYFII
jgi:hypothetical protein